MTMFFTPAVLLEYMLHIEAKQEAAYAQFPAFRAVQPFYDMTTGLTKIMLIGLDRQSRTAAQSAARDDQ